MKDLAEVFLFERVQDFRPEVRAAFIHLGLTAHEESAHSHMTMDIGYGLQNLKRFIEGPKSAVWVAWEGDKPVGFFAGKLHDLFFSRDLVAEDTVWYVLPEKRGTRVGLRLLELFEAWSESKGVKDIRIGQTSKLEHGAFDKIMDKRGYEYVGSYYVRKV